jgi:hypothetical protein
MLAIGENYAAHEETIAHARVDVPRHTTPDNVIIHTSTLNTSHPMIAQLHPE